MNNANSADQYLSYQKGWAAGAALRAKDPKFLEVDDEIKAAYESGYSDGYVARQTAMQKAADKYGHRPSILRLAAEESVERDLHA